MDAAGDDLFCFAEEHENEKLGNLKSAVRKAESDVVPVDRAAVKRASKSGSCMACDEPPKNGCWCPRHTRAYQTIYRASTSEDARKPISVDAKPDTSHDNAYPKTSYWNFVHIFGSDSERRKGFRQPILAIKAVSDFARDNPEGKGNKRSVRKWAVNLAQYAHTEGTRQESMHEDGHVKWDLEIFTNQLKHLRGWSVERSSVAWEEFKASQQ